jgi:hypothetical protein
VAAAVVAEGASFAVAVLAVRGLVFSADPVGSGSEAFFFFLRLDPGSSFDDGVDSDDSDPVVTVLWFGFCRAVVLGVR